MLASVGESWNAPVIASSWASCQQSASQTMEHEIKQPGQDGLSSRQGRLVLYKIRTLSVDSRCLVLDQAAAQFLRLLPLNTE